MTLGEPGGVGMEIAAKAWQILKQEGPVFFLIGDAELLARRTNVAGISVSVREISAPVEAQTTFHEALPVLPLREARNLTDMPGSARPENAEAVLASIRTAVQLVEAGEAAAVVTLPLQKESLYSAGFDFEGHTDYLAELARQAGYEAEPVMMLVARDLRTIPVTIHVALSDVPQHLKTDLIVRQGRIVARDLNSHFGLATPRLAVAGLNPHAGEGGRMGTEEATVIRPAVEQLRAEGISVSGPLPADTMFHEEARSRYDAALCMYHDQALIPVKTLDFHGGVNVTLGLPFIRTSPDHGTALSLAGTGRARADSLLAAIRMAARMAEVSTE